MESKLDHLTEKCFKCKDLNGDSNKKCKLQEKKIKKLKA